MPREPRATTAWARAVALGLIVAAGLASIIGSGGGVGFIGSPCGAYPDSCGPLPPTVAITPARITVQVGSPVTLTAQATGLSDPTYQWQRSADGGGTFTDIVGATAAAYALAAANLLDDGTVFRVVARQRSGSGPSAVATSRLAVSSTPGVVFRDGEFLPAEWQVSEISTPPGNGALHTEQRAASGGNPDAFRLMTHTMPANQQSLGVLNLSASAVYDPSVSGAVHVVDYAEDCALLGAGNPTFLVWSSLLVEQAGRRYRPTLPATNACASASWASVREAAALSASDFELLEGPACPAGQACPDFSATAPPLRFGFVRFAQANATPTTHGIDNWTVTVWRR